MSPTEPEPEVDAFVPDDIEPDDGEHVPDDIEPDDVPVEDEA